MASQYKHILSAQISKRKKERKTRRKGKRTVGKILVNGQWTGLLYSFSKKTTASWFMNDHVPKLDHHLKKKLNVLL